MSFVTDGATNRYYFTDKLRTELKDSDLNFDSHSSICKHFNLKEDNCNKYEYNPLAQEFTVDQINNKKDDRVLAEKWVRKLDFKTVVKELVIKPIVNPFKIEPPEITDVHIDLLRQWASARASVRDSVGASVWDLVKDLVWDLVKDSVWAYTSSFFILQSWKHTKATGGINPFQSCIDLWEMGIVPSFDGRTWRLHTKNGIAFEIGKNELNKPQP